MTLLYDVWFKGEYLGRYVEQWGESALRRVGGITCILATEPAGEPNQWRLSTV